MATMPLDKDMQTHHGTYNYSAIPCQTSACGSSPCGTDMEIPSVVSHPSRNASSSTTPSPTDSQNQQAMPRTRHKPHTGRVGYLRNRFQGQKLSEGTTTLPSIYLPHAWRKKTSKSYDSLFNKWLSWCRGIAIPFQEIHEVVNYLAHLYQEGYQYRSLKCSNLIST